MCNIKYTREKEYIYFTELLKYIDKLNKNALLTQIL